MARSTFKVQFYINGSKANAISWIFYTFVFGLRLLSPAHENETLI